MLTLSEEQANSAFDGFMAFYDGAMTLPYRDTMNAHYEIVYLWAKWVAYEATAGVFPIAHVDFRSSVILYPFGFCPRTQVEIAAAKPPNVWALVISKETSDPDIVIDMKPLPFTQVAACGFTTNWSDWLADWYGSSQETAWWEPFVTDITEAGAPSTLRIAVGNSVWEVTDVMVNGVPIEPDVITYQKKT